MSDKNKAILEAANAAIAHAQKPLKILTFRHQTYG